MIIGATLFGCQNFQRGDTFSLPYLLIFRPPQVFQEAVEKCGGLYDDMEPNTSKFVKLHVKYPNDDSHYEINTSAGKVRIQEIIFEGRLTVKNEFIPINEITEYSKNNKGETISQTVNFSVDAGDKKLSLDFHKLKESGKTHVVLSPTLDSDNT